MTDLKPCPFCGGVNILSGGDDKYVGVWCDDCGASGPNGYNCGSDWNRRASPWQPIETAPRDGTSVDLWIESGRGGYRLENHCFINGSWRDENGLPFGNPVTSSATHWMPLPEPPEGKK